MPRMKADSLRHTSEMLLRKQAVVKAAKQEVFDGRKYVSPSNKGGGFASPHGGRMTIVLSGGVISPSPTLRDKKSLDYS